jgi:hypothetical protein
MDKIQTGTNKHGISYEYNVELNEVKFYTTIEDVDFERVYQEPTIDLFKKITLQDLLI